MTTPDCRVNITLANNGAGDDRLFKVVVWPDQEPIENGTLLELDTHDKSEIISFLPEEEITFRLYENATDDGFIWNSLDGDYQFNCVDLINDNLGDFTTGYSQWLFKAKYSTENCTEEIELNRTDGGVADVITVYV